LGIGIGLQQVCLIDDQQGLAPLLLGGQQLFLDEADHHRRLVGLELDVQLGKQLPEHLGEVPDARHDRYLSGSGIGNLVAGVAQGAGFAAPHLADEGEEHAAVDGELHHRGDIGDRPQLEEIAGQQLLGEGHPLQPESLHDGCVQRFGVLPAHRSSLLLGVSRAKLALANKSTRGSLPMLLVSKKPSALSASK